MDALVYTAAAVLIAWGAAHLAPTRAVADSFGDIGTENRRILVMEWVAEGITHISLGTLVALLAATESGAAATDTVYRVVAGVLLALAALTAVTGARTPVVWFRVCPFVLTGSAVLLLLAARA